MIAIRAEIRAIEQGELPADDNPLVNAPHPLARFVADEWPHPYSRAEAAVTSVDKYWPPVARIDNAYGDRNLICTCPPLEDYAEAAE